MRSFGVKLLLVLLPVLLMVIGNVVFDPAHVLRDGPERRIVDLLMAGKPAGAIVNLDERRLVYDYLQRLPAAREVTVIGSSRGMQIRGRLFAGSTFFNASVSGATLEDLFAIAGEHARRGLLPRLMVIDLPPRLVGVVEGGDQWRVMEAGYDVVADASGLPRPAPGRSIERDRIEAIVSPAYFQQALREVKARRSLRLAAPLEGTDQGALMPDGSRMYPRSVRDRTPEQVEGMAVARAAALHRAPELAAFARVDAVSARRFEALIAFLRAHHVEVALVLAPFHPTLVRLLRASNDYGPFSTAEVFYRGLATRLAVPIGGSYDDVVAGCTGDEFYDSEHPRESCVARILRTMSVVE